MEGTRKQQPSPVGVDGPPLQVGWVEIPGVVSSEVGVLGFFLLCCVFVFVFEVMGFFSLGTSAFDTADLTGRNWSIPDYIHVLLLTPSCPPRRQGALKDLGLLGRRGYRGRSNSHMSQ